MDAPEFDTNVSFDFEEGAMNTTPSLGKLIGGAAALAVTASAASKVEGQLSFKESEIEIKLKLKKW